MKKNFLTALVTVMVISLFGVGEQNQPREIDHYQLAGEADVGDPMISPKDPKA